MSIASGSSDSSFSKNEVSLMAEALRRVRTARFANCPDTTAAMNAIMAEMRSGRRDMFSLVKAGARAGQAAAVN